TSAGLKKKANANRRRLLMNDVRNSRLIQRYTPGERANHWIVAIAFVLLALSGLALFHPYFYPLTGLFGGGTWTRILHPWIGVFMFLLFLVLAIRMARHYAIDRNDRQWLRQFGDVINKREERVPDVGKYNGGQKVLYFALILLMIGLLLTGLVMWREYFASFFGLWLTQRSEEHTSELQSRENLVC